MILESGGPLNIEKPTIDIVSHPLKGALRIILHNPNVKSTHNYSLVDNLAQTPCGMLVLKVLQICPSQRK